MERFAVARIDGPAMLVGERYHFRHMPFKTSNHPDDRVAYNPSALVGEHTPRIAKGINRPALCHDHDLGFFKLILKIADRVFRHVPNTPGCMVVAKTHVSAPKYGYSAGVPETVVFGTQDSANSFFRAKFK